MPRLPNGKVDRRNLPTPEFSNNIKGVKPETAMETVFLSTARDFLNDADFGVTDDLFDLGMKSLTAMRFISKINSLITTSSLWRPMNPMRKEWPLESNCALQPANAAFMFAR